MIIFLFIVNRNVVNIIFCSAWMRYHKHMKRKKALLAKKQEDARTWHRQRVERVHLELWIVSFHFVETLLDKMFFSGFGLSGSTSK